MVFCGVDIGTTSTKAVVLERGGRVLDEVAFQAEDEGQVYWHEHFCRVMDHFAASERFRGEEIACSVTGQGGSFVLTDGRYEPVSPVCSWTALAEEGIVRDLSDSLGAAAYYRLTGWPPHGWLAASKLRQMVERRQLPSDARWVATVPDFLQARLAGRIATDITSAQITGLADFQAAQWSRQVVAWTGIQDGWLPPVTARPGIVAEDVRTPWGRITLVTGSHDQYAAMEAAGLEKDNNVMLGTGTAWVINGRTGRPLYDDARFLIHPGRDLYPDCYGFIVTLGQIGAGFDRLLRRLGVEAARMEEVLVGPETPQGPIAVDLEAGTVELAGDAPSAVRRYMEWAGSVVAWSLDRCDLSPRLEKIIVTGGPMQSRFWPQAIADICNLTVEAVDYPYFTACGAALHARHAVLGPGESHPFPDRATVRTYVPQRAQEYRAWYRDLQEPSLGRRTPP